MVPKAEARGTRLAFDDVVDDYLSFLFHVISMAVIVNEQNHDMHRPQILLL